jgi:restriction endonuclease S subunit
MPFEAFADSVNKRIEPSEAAHDIYVGLEHLDPQDVHVRRWGKGSDVIGTKLRFRKGDIIFGRRRAYQRKLAVAEFDGICSAHAMVVRAKPEVMLPKFLPFLMMSDRFMNRAVEISVGSLSPTINWKTLKREEFALPTLDQQRRIAEILWSVDDVLQANIDQSAACHLIVQATVDEIFDANGTRKDIVLKPLDKLTTKIVDGVHKTPNYTQEGAPFIVIENLNRGSYIDFSDTRFVSWDDHREFIKRAHPEPGDVLVSKDGTLGLTRYVDTERAFSIFVSVALLKPKHSVLDGRFLAFYMRSQLFWEHVRRTSAGSALKHIHLRDFKTAPFPLFPIQVQRKHVEHLESLEALAQRVDEQTVSTRGLLKALMEAMT